MTDSPPLIRVRDLWKSFGDVAVLRDVSLDVPAGEKLVIIGPSGSGKSTLLRCLNGLEPIDGGTIELAGQPLAGGGRELDRQRAGIGMVFQQFNLFPHRTARENVMLAPRKVLKLPRRAAGARADELLGRVGLSDRAGHYPHQLSGGQQQRVAIARALAMEPAIMLFDEVTSALDPELVVEVLDVMRDLAADGMTMLVVTHEMRFAREVGTRLIFMDDGRILDDGSPARVLDTPAHPRAQSFLSRVL